MCKLKNWVIFRRNYFSSPFFCTEVRIFGIRTAILRISDANFLNFGKKLASNPTINTQLRPSDVTESVGLVS